MGTGPGGADPGAPCCVLPNSASISSNMESSLMAEARRLDVSGPPGGAAASVAAGGAALGAPGVKVAAPAFKPSPIADMINILSVV